MISLKEFDPDQLSVTFRNGVTMTAPVIGRKYTLTHSDATADLFLTIGPQFAYDKVNAMRDEVLLEWRMDHGRPFLYAYVLLDSHSRPDATAVRDAIFRRELPMALAAVRYGDRTFFATHSDLGHAPIWIHFDSADPAFNRFEYWGTPNDYQ